jgi:type IV pilus assembly protein PilB
VLEVKLGDLLLQDKIITQDQLQKALDYQKENSGIRIGAALVKLGFVDTRTIVRALLRQKPSPDEDGVPDVLNLPRANR